MFVNKNQAALLMQRAADLTLDQAWAELGYPMGLLNIVPNPEDWNVIGHRLCYAGGNSPVNGVNRSYVGIRTTNTGLPVVVILEKLVISVSVAGDILWRQSDGGLFVGQKNFLNRDSSIRNYAAAETNVMTMTDNAAAALVGTDVGQFGALANSSVVLDSVQTAGPLAIITNDENGLGPHSIAWTGAAISTGISFMAWVRVFDLWRRD